MQLCTVLGIPVRIHWTFVVLLAVFIVWATSLAGWAGAVLASVLASCVCGTVVLHELGHAVAARQFGIATEHITLYPFGGVAAIERMPEEPDQELVIALAGPAVNFALFGLFGLLHGMIGGDIVWSMSVMNLGMGLFNLIPAFPMDGGRVLRALLAKRLGFVPASKLAIRIGRVFAWAFLAVGIFWRLPTLLMVSAFLHFTLTLERHRLVWQNFHRQTGQVPPWDPDAVWPGGTVPPWVRDN